MAEDHPKFKELWTGKPSWDLNDLNELIGFHPEFDADRMLTRVHFWVAHPRKGASRRVTVNNITDDDVPGIREYLEEGRERNRRRLDPAVTTEEDA